MIKNDLQVSERAIRAYNLCLGKTYLLIFSLNFGLGRSIDSVA
jgi:hypothetical protein